jgi:hypothetical protein
LNFLTDHFDEEGATTPLTDHLVDSGHQVHGQDHVCPLCGRLTHTTSVTYYDPLGVPPLTSTAASPPDPAV